MGRPSTRATRNIGASVHNAPTMTRSEPRSVTRTAANQPPRAASGSARIHSTTIACDGSNGDSEPMTAMTAENGSAAPMVSQPSGRRPKAASAHSCATVARRGCSAPPPSTGHASRLANEATETTRAASTSHAPPLVKKPSSPRTGAESTTPRSSSKRWRS